MEIELNQGESIQLKQNTTTFWNVNSSAGRLSATYGTIVITNQRILLYKVSKTKKFLFGALSSLFEGNVLEAVLLLSQVTNIETKRPLGMGWNFIVSTSSGQCYGLTGKQEMGEVLNKLVSEQRMNSESQDENITSDEALAKLKKAKDKLDLGLITQMDFDILKRKYAKYID